MRVTHELQCAVGNTKSKVEQRIRNTQRIVQATEGDLTAEGKVVNAVELGIADVPAQLEGMPGGSVRNVVHPLEGIDGGAAGLVYSAPQVSDGRAAGYKSA